MGEEKTCALVRWKDDFFGDADAQKKGLKYIIPETVKYGSEDYTVNEIRMEYGSLDTMWVDEIEFPATIKTSNITYCEFYLDEINPKPGVKITLKCDPSVFSGLKLYFAQYKMSRKKFIFTKYKKSPTKRPGFFKWFLTIRSQYRI